MGFSDRSSIIIDARKVIGINNQYRVVQDNMENLQKKVNAFKARFKQLFKMGHPSFQDTHGNIIPQQSYFELLSSQREEDSKLFDMDKPLTRQILIKKMSDDFNILSQFETTVNGLPPFSYAQYNKLELFTKEMNAYDYPSKSHWSNIMNLERKAQFSSSRQDQIADLMQLL